ncbi:hypothetical protein LJC58_02605 [Lachnospiraceae bacterium OttesenSCG-928-D06]|nr:hypothetical protein [Lachnospiraceae bacterium OttesenSCG-928-D06]
MKRFSVVVVQISCSKYYRKLLLESIYPDKDYFSLTIYYPYDVTEASEVYKFIVPTDSFQAVRNMYYQGITNDYHIFEIFVECYSYDSSGSRTYSHSNFILAYAVNVTTKEIIQQRWEDEEGMWVYNENYHLIYYTDLDGDEVPELGIKSNGENSSVKLYENILIFEGGQEQWYFDEEMKNNYLLSLKLRVKTKIIIVFQNDRFIGKKM